MRSLETADLMSAAFHKPALLADKQRDIESAAAGPLSDANLRARAERMFADLDRGKVMES